MGCLDIARQEEDNWAKFKAQQIEFNRRQNLSDEREYKKRVNHKAEHKYKFGIMVKSAFHDTRAKKYFIRVNARIASNEYPNLINKNLTVEDGYIRLTLKYLGGDTIPTMIKFADSYNNITCNSFYSNNGEYAFIRNVKKLVIEKTNIYIYLSSYDDIYLRQFDYEDKKERFTVFSDGEYSLYLKGLK